MNPNASRTPREIDTDLSRIWSEFSRINHYLDNALESLKWAQEHGGRVNTYEANIANYRAKLVALAAEEAPLTAEFRRRGGWNRYFLVTNGNGHVHRERNCTTCYPTTPYGWLPELSDCDENAMVEEWGEKACTVCFPNAPTNPAYNRPCRRDREATEKRAAEKAARAAIKAEKAINASGELLVPYGSWSPWRKVDGKLVQVEEPRYELVRTKVAARNALSAAVKDFGFYGPTHPSRFQGAADILADAVRGAGLDAEKVIETAAKKALKEGAKHDYRKLTR